MKYDVKIAESIVAAQESIETNAAQESIETKLSSSVVPAVAARRYQRLCRLDLCLNLELSAALRGAAAGDDDGFGLKYAAAPLNPTVAARRITSRLSSADAL